MRIILDAMGSDHHPDPEVQGAIEASRRYGIEVILVGREEELRPRLEALDTSGACITVVHAPEVLEMTDKPAETARRKAENSMAVGMELLKKGEGDAFVTAGNTGGAMANALFRLGRIRGVKRPALTALFPTRRGHCVVLDIGANAECKPEYLVQFAIMGSVYAEKVLGVSNPRVGLLSNGEEPGKGNDLVKATYPLLAESGLHFIGNVEGKELFGGEVDVVVTDGFTGNVLLKGSEAVVKLLIETLKEAMLSSWRTKIGALLAQPAFDTLKSMLNPDEIGAAPLLGINGLVLVGHGRSGPVAITSALRAAKQAVEADLLNELKSAIEARLHA
ncbi:MAG TPA: phosphate acyltransferase PlsX [Anaerolineae bacterium]|nr:phosphate acyltransferase PlsX [Anaerolineae bacterium]HID83814.1 phosphate acyltransferase PlsX [Anaerolineales bacterium]HIQ09668.1 phosphate acyltransferase PlsX [Anaerolineaceae bacterium]